jgi:hypothetical protein
MSTHAETSKFYRPLATPDQIQYREYKLMLNPDRFHDEKAFHKFFKLAHRAAKSLGVRFDKIGDSFKPHQREVVFYDTPHFKLYNHGFILRKRTFYHHSVPDARYELVLKFRHPDQQVALAVDPRPRLPCEYTVKFKEEILLPRDGALGMRLVYSHNCELDSPNIVLTQRFETTAEAFPALKTIGANPKASLSIVNGLSIQEYLVDLGMLDFGHKLEAKATLAVWRTRNTNSAIVAEFSYQLRFDSPEAVRRKQRELSELFYTDVQSRALDWVKRGTTKTAIVYGSGNITLKHQE